MITPRLLLFETTKPDFEKYYLELAIANLNLFNSALAFGANKNKPIIFGTNIAKIIASEKAITEPSFAAAPTNTKTQKMNL